MKIETKFKLNQEVWLIYSDRPTKAVVEGINVRQRINQGNPIVEYSLKSINNMGISVEDGTFSDSDLHETKTKAIEALFLKGNIDHR